MPTSSRREFTQQAIGSLLAFSLLETLFQHDLWADEIKPLTGRWLADVNQLGQDLKDQKIKQLVWQQKIEELFAQVDMNDLLKLIDFDRLTGDLKLKDRGETSLRFSFGQVEGLPQRLVFGKQIFALKQGRSVVPHGHNNMATAFLILGGELRGRHYDRVQDEPEHMIIKPTIDRQFAVGECSTVSDFKDNVHWFQATSDRAFIFNIHVLGVDPGSKLHTGRVYVDPAGEKLSGDLIRARRIDYDEAQRLHG
jgi:hypothetical protein